MLNKSSLSIPILYLAMSLQTVVAAGVPRVIVSTDIGGSDPDDYQSMVHYLVYADRFQTEGLISSPPNAGRLEHILECLDMYEKDFDNLQTWSSSYPLPEDLRGLSRQGAIEAQSGEMPDRAISDGAKLIIERAQAELPEPLYILVWGSITDVAQAVHHAPEIVSRLRIYSIGSWNTRHDQKARDYLFNEHPDLWWIECDSTFRGMYMGGMQEGEFGNELFLEKNVARHGHLGDFLVSKMAQIKMGDTPSVLYLLHGLPDNPEAEHWGGAFIWPFPESRPTYWHDNPDPSLSINERAGAKTVYKWRLDYLTDWKNRMDRLLMTRPTGQ